VAIVLCDGEIMSNLALTQRLYDVLKGQGVLAPPDPIDPVVAVSAVQQLLPQMVAEDGVAVTQLLIGDSLTALLHDLAAETASESGMRALLEAAFESSKTYHDTWLAKTRSKK
jgi:CRISPR-associated protein Csc2